MIKLVFRFVGEEEEEEEEEEEDERDSVNSDDQRVPRLIKTSFF